MARQDPQLKLRLPADLRDRVKAAADRAGRSMNAEIIVTLEREFPPPQPIQNRVTELLALINKLEAAPSSMELNKTLKDLQDKLDEALKIALPFGK